MNEFENIANDIISELNKYGIKSYIYHLATTGSIYIRFDDSRMRSIRIGDHPGRVRYRYKWNVRTDIKKAHWRKINNIWRYYVPFKSWKLLIPILVKRFNDLDRYKQYNYKTPLFKNG